MRLEPEDVEITIAGHRLPMREISITEATEASPYFGMDQAKPGTFDCTVTMHLDEREWRAFMNALRSPQRGATDATLAKRTQYPGGRKARSAWRRLRAKGFNGIMRVEHPKGVDAQAISVRRSWMDTRQWVIDKVGDQR